MTKANLISCVIPVFNGARFIADTIENIFAQTYRPIETVVVDDGSTDNTVEVLSRFDGQVNIVHQANAGPAAARNRGLEVAKGDYIAFQDADDLWLPEKLEVQMELLVDHPEAELCTCLMENFWVSELAEEAKRLRGTAHAQAFPSTWQGILARRDVFDRVGALDTGAAYSDIREWLYRARAVGVIVEHVDRVLVHRRIHPDNRSRGQAKLEPEVMLRLAEMALARRRQ